VCRIEATCNGPVDADAGLVAAHDHHDEGDTQTCGAAEGQGVARLAQKVVIGDAVGGGLLGFNAACVL
jgi:hypothetical protein